MGGYIAFEMAQQLLAQGQAVALLALLDTPVSQTPHCLESLTLAGRLQYRVRKWETRMRFHLASLTPFSPQQRMEYMTQLIRRNTLGDEDRRAAAQAQADIIKGLPPEVQEVIAVNRVALWEYHPQPYPGRIVLFKSREAAGIYYGWTEMAQGGVEIHLVPGRHAAIVEEPHVQVLAAELKACLDRVSGEGKSL
jgi:aspartate racemase